MTLYNNLYFTLSSIIFFFFFNYFGREDLKGGERREGMETGVIVYTYPTLVTTVRDTNRKAKKGKVNKPREYDE